MVSDLKQLKELATPFAGLVKEPAPGKFGDYIEHSAVTQRLLLHCGPYDQTVIREILNLLCTLMVYRLRCKKLVTVTTHIK